MSVDMNWGNIFIAASLLFSLAALVFAVMSAGGKESYAAPCRIIYLFSSVLIAASLILLLFYFVSFDFRFAYVYDNSSRDLPLAYRVAAVWAGKEGSFLLWLFFLNISGIFMLNSDKKNAQIVLSIIVLTQIFILVILAVESPFVYVWAKHPEVFSPGSIPGDGLGLNPLLKDPWMVAHPPVLFLGYASAAVPFGFALSGLIAKDYTEWVRGAYPWLLLSMVTLGIGIFLGGYWAYAVLGWGGYWGWDSVENSSLIPWIIAVALLHGLLIQKRTGMLKRTNLFFALVYFLTVLYSTWLTRSGVLTNFSVHSFAASKIAPFLLFFLMLYFLGSVSLFIIRFRGASGKKIDAPLFDWRTLTVYGIIALLVYTLIIMFGTSLPLISSAFMEQPSSVTEVFYNNFSIPFGLLVIVLMVLSTVSGASPQSFKGEYAALGITSIAAGILINAGHTASPVASLFTCASFFLIACSIRDMLKTKSKSLILSRLSHIGVGILVIGIITSNFPSSMIQKKLVKDKEYDLGPIGIAFTGFKKGGESSLKFMIRKNSEPYAVETAYRFDEKTGSLYREPYIMHTFLNDLYISPEIYESGIDSVSQLIIAKGEEKEIGGITVRFIEFRTEHMTSGEPTTSTELLVNGVRISPGIAFKQAGVTHMDRAIPGTGRFVSLRDIDASNKRIMLYISPGKNSVIPPDSVVLTLTVKRLIWIVWLGTVIISVGGLYIFVRAADERA